MEVENWAELQDRVFALYDQGRLREALEVAGSAAEIFPEKVARTSYWRACLCSLLGETQTALAILEGAVNHGIWWSEATLMSEPDLAPVRNAPQFREIVLTCKRLGVAAQNAARPQLMILPPGNAESVSPPPLLMALHSRGSNAPELVPYWQPAAGAGAVVAIPQSSQMYSKDEFCWDDQNRAAAELMWAYEEVRDSHCFDPHRVVLAGTSQGGRLAIRAALKGNPFQSRGAGGQRLHNNRRQRSVLRSGLPAAKRHEGTRPVEQAGCPPGMGHRFPPDFGDTLPLALEFVLRGD